jgi:glucose-1-phosphate cytidylyltransferase
MIEIGGKPILWHVMKIYSYYGINEFIVCLGYKGYVIKEYFQNYFLHSSNVTIDVRRNQIHFEDSLAEPWRITLVDTGEETQIGGRIKRIRRYVENEAAFCVTYGDGLGDVNITRLIEFHTDHGRLATVTAVQPPGRFGALDLDDAAVRGFKEKPVGDGGWINGGYFVLSPGIFDYIEGDLTVWEQEPLERLAAEDQLRAWYHDGFWQPMDTLRDKRQLEEMWTRRAAPWKIW